MKALLVFIPNTTVKQLPGYLIGYLREDKNLRGSIYVLGTKVGDKALKCQTNQIVGTYTTELNEISAYKNAYHPVWVTIICVNQEVYLNSCIINNESIPVKDCLLIVYDCHSLLQSELLLPNHKKFNEINHFKILASDLQSRKSCSSEYGFRIFSSFIDIVVMLFSVINFIISICSYVTKYSTLAINLRTYYQTVLWIKNTYREVRFINLKIGNSLMSVITDMLLGWLLFYFIARWKNSDEMFDSISMCTENVISSISHIVKWLMGSPAGLKLNQPLSSLFGSLVLYYLDIWWSFLSTVRPVLEIFFQILIRIGFLGLTFQLAVCADIFAIISFHVYCIYVYAARLYEIQGKGLYSLSRLFLGKKRNPEPGKVDSYPYTTEELLIGTISFAVLLFLLPTTLVYYVVFTVMRVGVMLISGLLTRTIYFMQTLPVYVTFLWVFLPSYTATMMKLTPCEKTTSLKHGCLIAKAASSSWMDTIKLCKPEIISPPRPVKFGETAWKIIVGKLV
ncbi:uncharacterized protein PIG-Q [Halyomorpha halys]|uniref:uncharacterized protein PIG-Q n=1 Tax=Halyomorpha halys TaxID=286706 RepID=UPI0006D503E1|nr:N-acetylglucosaminyl-phosphatidylinositol biosynthetic protein gpi1 [Halyomorpha halys]